MASRGAYNIAYVGCGACSGAGVARSVIWQTGVVISLSLWVKAGLKIMDSYVF